MMMVPKHTPTVTPTLVPAPRAGFEVTGVAVTPPLAESEVVRPGVAAADSGVMRDVVDIKLDEVGVT